MKIKKRKQISLFFFDCSLVFSRLISDIMCILGIFGIILMIIENELTFHYKERKNVTVCLLIKSTITFTTMILVSLVVYYHRIDLKLYCVDNSIDDWRIVLTRTKIISIVLEVFICMIHPIPDHFLGEWSSQYVKLMRENSDFTTSYRPTKNLSNSTVRSITTVESRHANDPSTAYVPLDVMLSLPSKIVVVLFLLHLFFRNVKLLFK